MLVVGREHLKGNWRITLGLYFLLEILWIGFWFGTIMWIHTSAPTVTGFSYRSDLTNAFVHVTSLMMIIYATSSAHKTPDFVVFVILLAVVLYDVQMVVTTLKHASAVAVAHAKQVQLAVMASGLSLSGLGLIWYIIYAISGVAKERRTGNTQVYTKF